MGVIVRRTIASPTAGSLLALLLTVCGAVLAASPASAAPPPNDDFANATVIEPQSDGSYAVTSSRTDATAEPGEPRHAGDPEAPARSVWFSWQPSEAATVRLSSSTYEGSRGGTCYYVEHDLAVYVGDSLAELEPVASGRATGDCNNPSLVFDVTPGTEYRIAIDAPDHTAEARLFLHAGPLCTINGTEDDDRLTGTARADTICGAGGDDVFTGLAGGDRIVGGPGSDTVRFAAATGPVTVDLAAGTATVTGQDPDVLQEIEDVVGSRYDDTLGGDTSGNTLAGGAGADTLLGRPGSDDLRGGGGEDVLRGGADTDDYDGGAGSDTADFFYATSVEVDLASGTASGESDRYTTDTLTRIENVNGSSGPDRLVGTDAGNRLQGAGGDDTVRGRGGPDRLLGAGGDDSLDGGAGEDVCGGGTGRDRATTCERTRTIP